MTSLIVSKYLLVNVDVIKKFLLGNFVMELVVLIVFSIIWVFLRI